MNTELITIVESNIDNEIKDTVNARDLYEYFEVKQEFANWIKNRIEKYDLIEGRDFLIILSKSPIGRPLNEYYLTIEVAKELSIAENNDKSIILRRYLIEAEKRLKNIQQTPEVQLAQAVILANDILLKMKPKIEAYDAFMKGVNSIDMGEVAKMLGVGRNTLFKSLRNKKILLSTNIPYQQYMKYFEVITVPVVVGDQVYNKSITKVKPEGVEFIKKILEEHSTPLELPERVSDPLCGWQ